jgi:hypothetical protein
MAVSDDVSYLSRFLVKFVEIIAVGLATAVSGYLIAHLSGALSSPTPAPPGAAVQVAPNPSTVSQSLPTQPIAPNSIDSNAQLLAPPQGTNAAAIAQPATSEVNASAVAQPVAPQQDVDAPPLAQPARRSMNMAKSTPAHKHIEITTSVVESKRDQESFVARIRAALGNADRTESLDVPPHQSDGSRGPAAVTSQPKAIANPPAAVAAAPSGAAELRPVPVQQAPIEPNPPTAIEIKSRPVTAIQSSSTPAPGKETGVISGLEEILRHDPLAGGDAAPRPPMPVGQ